MSYSGFILIGLCAGMFSAAAITLVLDVYRFFKKRHNK
jgi:H+/Cl- antiporter ClcA